MVKADSNGRLLPPLTPLNLVHPHACDLHLWTGEDGPCPECRSVVEVDRRPTERTPLPPTAYTSDYRAGYLAGHADSLAGLAPRPGEGPVLVAAPAVVSREEYAAGYDAAVCAHRLGADVQKMIDDDTLEPTLESVPAIVDRLLALRPELVAVPHPRKLLADRLLERFLHLPTELDRPVDCELALECFERAINWYFWAYRRPPSSNDALTLAGFTSGSPSSVPYRVLSEADLRFTPPDMLDQVERVFAGRVTPVLAFLNLFDSLLATVGLEKQSTAEELLHRVANMAALVHIETKKGHGT